MHEGLNSLRSLQELSPCTSEIVCLNLAGLAELYASLDGFLNMESIREAFSHRRENIRVSEVLDGSVQMLDICSSLRCVMVEVKEHLQELQFSLRRRNGDLSIEKTICKYAFLRKKMKKSSKNIIKSLDRMALILEAPPVEQCADSCSSMVQILIQVNVATVLVYKSLLSFLSSPVLNTKMTKWSLITQMRRKKKKVAAAAAAAGWEDASVNEFTSADAVILSKKAAQGISAGKLVSLESNVETIEIHMGREYSETWLCVEFLC